MTAPIAGSSHVPTYLASTALPDLRETVDDQILEGDKVVSRFTTRGTHRGKLMGAAPTGNQITIEGIDISRIEQGRIVEAWVIWDAHAMMEQIGLRLTPDAPTAAPARSP